MGFGKQKALNQTLTLLLASSWGALPFSNVQGVRVRKSGTGTRQQQCQEEVRQVLSDHNLKGVFSWERRNWGVNIIGAICIQALLDRTEAGTLIPTALH